MYEQRSIYDSLGQPIHIGPEIGLSFVDILFQCVFKFYSLSIF